MQFSNERLTTGSGHRTEPLDHGARIRMRARLGRTPRKRTKRKRFASDAREKRYTLFRIMR